jgi:hypothetical protein
MPRPKRTDDAVIAAAARNVVSQLIESSPNDYNEKERDEYEADLRRALRYAPSLRDRSNRRNGEVGRCDARLIVVVLGF